MRVPLSISSPSTTRALATVSSWVRSIFWPVMRISGSASVRLSFVGSGSAVLGQAAVLALEVQQRLAGWRLLQAQPFHFANDD